MSENRLIILTGPSGVGKTPLDNALFKFFPEVRKPLKKIVMMNSRKPRPGEKDGTDYFFRSRKFLNQLKKQNKYIVVHVRGDIQALNMTELKQMLKKHNVLFEGNTFIAREILTRLSSDIISKHLSVFLSPLSKTEIQLINKYKSDIYFHELLTNLVYNKLKRRIRKYGESLTPQRKENLKIRAQEAYSELKEAWRFDWVIPNHDGEDSDNWHIMPYPIGDARITLNTFVDLLKNGHSENAEKWERDLVS